MMRALTETMRWYGPEDAVSLRDIRQAGATGVVTALHGVPAGEAWPAAAIAERRRVVEAAGLQWRVVESVPVHDDLKRRAPGHERYLDAYRLTLRRLAAEGIEVVTYNFMPVCDWTRTDLAYVLPDGSEALRFAWADYVAFDCYVLGRAGAEDDYDAETLARARARLDAMTEPERASLYANVGAGLPGGTTAGAASIESLREQLARYEGYSADDLRAALHAFVAAIAPTAEELGLRLAIHPDDPPFRILGLPRVMSSAEDARALLAAVPSPANGLCFCTGSFGAPRLRDGRPALVNDVVAMAREFAARTHFVHLRATRLDAATGDFYEANHLDGDVDMYGVLEALMRAAAEKDHDVPMRPDHGHRMLDDLGKATNPGYSAIGRLRGLAELRGVMYALWRA